MAEIARNREADAANPQQAADGVRIEGARRGEEGAIPCEQDDQQPAE